MPKGVKGSGKAKASRVSASHASHVDDEPALGPTDDGRARCRIEGCGTVLQGGTCPACAFRARKYASVLRAVSKSCECGAPIKPSRPGALRVPDHCPPCKKLRATAARRGIAVT